MVDLVDDPSTTFGVEVGAGPPLISASSLVLLSCCNVGLVEEGGDGIIKPKLKCRHQSCLKTTAASVRSKYARRTTNDNMMNREFFLRPVYGHNEQSNSESDGERTPLFQDRGRGTNPRARTS